MEIIGTATYRLAQHLVGAPNIAGPKALRTFIPKLVRGEMSSLPTLVAGTPKRLAQAADGKACQHHTCTERDRAKDVESHREYEIMSIGKVQGCFLSVPIEKPANRASDHGYEKGDSDRAQRSGLAEHRPVG